MKSAVENVSATRVKLTIELSADDLKPSVDAAYQRIAEQVNIPGFRKGKVPPRMIDQRFGREVVLEEAVNDAIPRSLAEVMVDNKIVQMSRPKVDVTKLDVSEGLEYTAEIDIRPEFSIPDVSGLKVVVDDAVVTDEQVEEQLTELRQRFGTLLPVERSAKDGDVLLIDLKGTHEEQVVDELAASALSYALGSEGLLPGFDAAVRGAKAGEVRNFVFTPESGEWGGKGIIVEVTVQAVRERELPAADDSFAMLASEFDTIDELRTDIRERLGRVRVVEQAYQARDAAHDALMAAVKVEVPEGAIQDEIDQHFEDGHGDDAHREEFEHNTRTGIKSRMVLDKVGEEQQLKVTDPELSQWLVQQSQQYGMAPDQFADQLVKSGNIQMAIADVRRAKALSWVLENVSVVDRSGKPVDLSSVLGAGQSSEDWDDAFDAASDGDEFEADE